MKGKTMGNGHVRKRGKVILLTLLLITGIGGELVARYCLGLGEQPLSVSDAEIDYIFAPNQRCRRFGNRIIYNDCSMRSDFNCAERSADVARRIFVVGDSVVNGGTLTDHYALATTILQEYLDPTRRSVQVCNVSAGSWGPGNYAAYFRKYENLAGTNDILIVEVNSHDLWEDDPSLSRGKRVGRDRALPDRQPICALMDGFSRYFIPYLRRMFGLSSVNTKVDVPKWELDVNSASAKYNLQALDSLYALPVARRCMLVYRSREEAFDKSSVSPGEAAFRAYAKEHGIDVLMPEQRPESDFRDAIHANDSGQRKLATALLSYVRSM